MNPARRSLLLGVITILCWGSLATFGNLLIHLPPFFLLGTAFLLGALPALLRPREMFPDWKTVVWGVAGYFGYHFLLFTSFRYAPAIEANLINYLWPMFMVVLTPIFFRGEKLQWFHFLGIGLSSAGCVLLVMGDGLSLKTEFVEGYLMALAAALIWPVYSLVKKRMGETAVWAVGGFCFITGLLCFGTHALLEPRVELTGVDAWKLAWMGLGPFGLAFYTWDQALKLGNPKVIGALAYLTPLLSTLGLTLFAGQTLSARGGLAMALIIGGAGTGLLDFFPSKVLNKV